MPELKPCPFCGGEAIQTSWGVRCSGCGVWMGDLTSSEPGQSHRGVDVWNRRASDEAVAKAREALEQHLRRDPLCASGKTKDAVESALAALKEAA